MNFKIMSTIEDTGKVWFKGRFGPEYAVRVGDTVFVPGKGEHDTVSFHVEDNTLCVDIHDKKGEKRTGRRFPLNLPTSTPATLFNGFEKTKHADVLVVTHEDEGVEGITISGEVYRNESIAAMEMELFFQWLTKNGWANKENG